MSEIGGFSQSSFRTGNPKWPQLKHKKIPRQQCFIGAICMEINLYGVQASYKNIRSKNYLTGVGMYKYVLNNVNTNHSSVCPISRPYVNTF